MAERVEQHPNATEQHPLERVWAVWYNGRDVWRGGSSRAKAPSRHRGGELTPLKRVGSFDTIAGFWRYMNNISPPSGLKQDLNLCIFQNATDPKWEHPDNRNGGRWTFSVDASEPAAADSAWMEVYLALVGEQFDPCFEVVGITASRRRDYIRISVWTKNRTNDSATLEIGRMLKSVLAEPLGPGLKLEYQDHGAAFEAYRHVLA